jgi:YHS domain-containing protein
MLILLRILAVLGILWILRRILAMFAGNQGTSTKPASGEAEVSKTVKDPVCGMYMDPRLAIRMQHTEGDLFFCSEECRRRYLAGAN